MPLKRCLMWHIDIKNGGKAPHFLYGVIYISLESINASEVVEATVDTDR